MSEPRQGPDPTQPSAGYPPAPDPAYAEPYTGGQYYPPANWQGYGYPAGYPGGAPMTPTDQLPTYWQPGMGYPPAAPPPPQPPKSPRWLWIAAAAAVLVVAGLVAALVVVSSSSRESTVVAPQFPPTAPQATTPAPVPPTRLPLPTAPRPVPIPTDEPGSPPGPGQTGEAPVGAETVLYSVTGEGRAINITYVDTGGVMQTEFNVALPWSKEVTLSAPAKGSASVAVVNVGRDVTCSVSVDGAQVRQRTGRGLTICSAIG